MVKNVTTLNRWIGPSARDANRIGAAANHFSFNNLTLLTFLLGPSYVRESGHSLFNNLTF
ncbi:MAG: hypothetical protein DME43_05255 [Verrucomicrobia bacterium]|nr:MAG: hypothetical protein DME43_05255 [Verrucomicrobiota bacterium]